MPANLENSAVATGLEKVSFHYNPKERQCQRILIIPHNCTHLTANKEIFKILQARLQQYINCEFPDVQAGFRKGRGTRDLIANICWIIEKQENSRKTSISALSTTPTKVHLVKAMVFPVVMYGCESWTIKKAEQWRIDAFELWFWRRLLWVPWTARRSN